ncbi:MAG TPA: tetratricopeptide repeat protein, partial [Candidatus Eremiobacteraeota bacterium]|nr:tetratricopeptide repeat protein [Candidatus Eremiobacteraeota bacterium]
MKLKRTIIVLTFLLILVFTVSCNEHEKAIKLNNDGMVFVKQGKYEEGIKLYDEALKLDPDYAVVWYNKGT